ncbi:branched-chain amino acid transaminase [Kallotenue papyrolyticum]|uniref:branched-chain amino acid transaminase n=1 Tax=Kallotenue papyrolyticum TaxID=1325125 RepID=UPI00047858FA|nr:branched-chain amino acid transaminase [Kallotenue papyrolyticum]
MPMTQTPYLWFNGEIVPWERATVHVMSHALHYGSSVFEGIRCYDTPRGPAIFRLRPHIERLIDSARIYRMPLPYSAEHLAAACHAVIAANGLRSAYLRPIAFRGFGELGVHPKDTPVEVAIAAIPWGAYLGDDALERGVDVCVSSWVRPAPNTLPTLAKAGGNYLSSQLIVMEAQRHGYVEGIALDASGHLSEGSGENLFVVRNGVIMTPPLTASVLPGITRDTVITIARELGFEVREQTIPREALYVADELFFTGTAAEITPIRSVDGVVVKAGGRGPITAAIAARFFGLFTGETEDTHHWLEYPTG